MPRFFISYRRRDSQDTVGRISDRLIESFGEDSVFMDVDSVPLGADFRREVQSSIDASEFVLVAIGPGWLDARDKQGRRRLEDPEDTVRVEVETALAGAKARHGKLKVVPLLLGGTEMPAEHELPESIRDLAFSNAHPVRPNPDFNDDVRKLLQKLGARSWRLPLRVAGAVLAAGLLGTLAWWGLSQLDLAGPEIPEVLPSQVEFTGGSLSLKAGSLVEYVRGRGELETLRAGAEGPEPVRVVSNARAELLASEDQYNPAGLSFSVVNGSDGRVTLSDLRVVLLGAFWTHEDQIPDPVPPHVAHPISDLYSEIDEAERTDYADLREVFADADTPIEHLAFRIVSNSDPDLVEARIDEQQRLDLSFPSDALGRATITVEAVDPFELSATNSFDVVRIAVGEVVELRIVEQQMYVVDESPASLSGASFESLHLGELVFDFDVEQDEVIAGATSMDLFPDGEVHVMQPGASQPFYVQLFFATRVADPRPRTPDALVGFEDVRRRLVASPPRLQRFYHVFALLVLAVSDEGEEAELMGDRLYVVETRATRVAGASDGVVYSPGEGTADFGPWLESVARLVNATQKIFAQTRAYEMALECKSVPPDFDPSEVSPHCYFHDADSPFRRPGAAATSREPWPRSNGPEVLAGVRAAKPELWTPLERALEELAGGELGRGGTDPQEVDRLARKARSLLELAAKRQGPPVQAIRQERRWPTQGDRDRP